MFRTVGSADDVLEAIRPLTVRESKKCCASRTSGCTRCPGSLGGLPVHHRRAAARAWGTPRLFGPGSFLVAHTDEEHLDLHELPRAI